MVSLVLALLAAAAEPAAPSPPQVPTAEAPRAPAAAARSQTSTSTSTSTPTPTLTSTGALAPIPKSPLRRPGDYRPLGDPPLKHAEQIVGEPIVDLSGPPKGALSDPISTPPNLTGAALREELRSAAQRRQEELATLARERARVEKLAADLAAARGALREETARLEELVKKAAAEKAAARAEGGKGPLRKPSAEDEKRALAMAKTLKGMKPDQAASLLGRLDRPLAVSLLRHLRPGDAGAVLEKMKPDAAADLFALMASPEAGGGTR